MEPLLLSKSRINTYCLCPEKYRLTYVENILMDKTPVSMIEGSAIHHIVENSLVYGKNITNMAELASMEFWSGIKLSDTEYATEEDMEKAKVKTLAESKVFLAKIGQLDTWQMETWHEHPLVNPVTGVMDENIIIRGLSDILDHPKDNMTRVIDIKTSSKSPNMDQANRSMELTVYAYLLACQTRFDIEVPVSLLYLVRTKEPKVLWLESMRKKDDFIKLHETVLQIASAIRQGLFWKNQGMQCSWCQHEEICFGKSIAA